MIKAKNKQQSTTCNGSGRRWQWKAADKDDDSGGNCRSDGGGCGRAMVAMVAMVDSGNRAEAMAVETRAAKQWGKG